MSLGRAQPDARATPACAPDAPAAHPAEAYPPETRLIGARAINVFAAFALACFLSTLIRGITATLSPTLTREFTLNAGDLGLLAGGYFFGFALTQLPLGRWLDRFGPKRVILGFLGIAIVGCLLFSMAEDFAGLLAARVLTGVGVSACLMAALTGYRRWLTSEQLLRSYSWMLMASSTGLVAATLPVDWLLPLWGWRPLFWALAVGMLLAMLWIGWVVPGWGRVATGATGERVDVRADARADAGGYAEIWRDPFFRKVAPMVFWNYGGFIAVQTLWVVPWLVRVHGDTPRQAATGLFWISSALMASYWLWGLVNPVLVRSGLSAARIMAWGLPLSLVMLAVILFLGPAAGAGAWTAYAVLCTVITLAQPATAIGLPARLAGRALSAMNLVIFVGIFVMQWNLGLLIDAFGRAGLDTVMAFRAALASFMVGAIVSYIYFLRAPPHNRPSVIPVLARAVDKR